MASPKATAFRALHDSGCFLLPNPWDVGTTVALEQMGFAALATTSAGFAFSRGLPDNVDAIPCEMMLAHIREVVGATHLPVNADFQNGYAADAAGVAAHVTACVATGVAGLSIEDASGDPARPLYERTEAIERVKAARAAIDASGTGVVLTARCEAFLVGDPDAEKTAVDRLVAFAEAGADCLYAPRIRDLGIVATIVRAVAPRPVNALVTMPGLTVAQLAEVGVRRVSVGGTLARVAWGAFLRSAQELISTGTFESFGGAVAHDELDRKFSGRRGRARN